MQPQSQPPEMDRPPQRVVSLVPSVTESLFTLGMSEAVVGVTDFCIYPEGRTEALPKVGGTKNASMEAILALRPDLVIANQEENTEGIVQDLVHAGVRVWLTFPKTVEDAVGVLYGLAGLFRKQEAMLAVRSLATAVDYSRAAAAGQKIRYFCPIWFDRLPDGTPWWMTFNRDTYPHDVLSLLGGENVFADRERRYPLEADLGRVEAADAMARDIRYPRISVEELRQVSPDLVLLPSEPYEFGTPDVEPLRSILGEGTRFEFIDGSLITWHGTRLARALELNLAAL